MSVRYVPEKDTPAKNGYGSEKKSLADICSPLLHCYCNVGGGSVPNYYHNRHFRHFFLSYDADIASGVTERSFATHSAKGTAAIAGASIGNGAIYASRLARIHVPAERYRVGLIHSYCI